MLALNSVCEAIPSLLRNSEIGTFCFFFLRLADEANPDWKSIAMQFLMLHLKKWMH